MFSIEILASRNSDRPIDVFDCQQPALIHAINTADDIYRRDGLGLPLAAMTPPVGYLIRDRSGAVVHRWYRAGA